VWFRVRENAKVEVRRVNFVGNHAVSDAELRDVVVTREGSLAFHRHFGGHLPGGRLPA